MQSGNELFAAIGDLVLEFVLGLVRSLLAPIFANIFGEPAAE